MDRLLRAASVVVVAVPVVVAAARTAGTPWFPSLDWAIEVLQIGDVGTSHTPLVGVPSRFGWNHPGPALYWWAAPFYRLGGPNGVLVAVAASNLAALLVVLAVAWRRGGTALGCVIALGVAVLMHALGPSFLVDPWNPWAAFFPFLAFLMLMWSASCGSTRSLLAGVIVGSFCVVSHVGYLPMVAAPLAAAVGLMVWDRRRRPSAAPSPRGHGSPAGWAKRHWVGLAAAGLLALIWVPPIVQQVQGPDGNVAALLDYFSDPDEPVVGAATGLGVMARQLSLDGPWVTGEELGPQGLLTTASVWPALLAVVAAAGLGIACLLAGRRAAANLAFLAVSASVAGVVAASRIAGLPAPYLVRWAWAVGLLLWVSIVFSGWRLGQWWWSTANRRPRPVKAVGGAVVLAGAAVLVAVTVTADTTVPLPESSEALAALTGPAETTIDPDRPLDVEWVDRATLGGPGVGLAVHLLREGVPVRLDQERAPWWGSWRAAPRQPSWQVLTLVTGSDLAQWEADHPGRRPVIRYDPLTGAERDRARDLDGLIRRALGPEAPPGLLFMGSESHQRSLVEAGAERREVEELAALQAAGESYSLYYCERDC